MSDQHYRDRLSWRNKLRRSIYRIFCDQCERILIKRALVDSYQNFINHKRPYPFVNKRELKPRARIVGEEYKEHNSFLVIFCEGSIKPEHKKYIRFFDSNKITKESIELTPNISLSTKYHQTMRSLQNSNFETFFESLQPVDYALLIQQDQTIKRETRYILSHMHVRIDWPISEAAEDMGCYLKYIYKDIYEKGEKQATDLQNKLFEHFGFHHQAGGRRTAAIVAAQYLARMDFISTVYISSSETRSFSRLNKAGTTKFVLMPVSYNDAETLINENNLKMKAFESDYVIDIIGDDFICLFQVFYQPTVYARPPEDGKLRELNPDYQWLTVARQHIIPKPTVIDARPLIFNTIYN